MFHPLTVPSSLMAQLQIRGEGCTASINQAMKSQALLRLLQVSLVAQANDEGFLLFTLLINLPLSE